MKARAAGLAGSVALHAALIGGLVGTAVLLSGPETEPDASVEANRNASVPDIVIDTRRPPETTPDFEPPEVSLLEMEIEIALPFEEFIPPDSPTPLPESPELVPAPVREPPPDRPLKPNADKRTPAPAVESPPSQVRNPPPKYPRVARKRGQQGSVLVAFDILADGSIDNPRIAESSGYPSLDEAALRAVRAWKFLPATRNGRPVEATHKIRFTFKLQD